MHALRRSIVSAVCVVVLVSCGGHGHGALPPLDRFHALSGAADYTGVVLADHPTLYYRLDDTGAAAADSSGNGLNGTIGASVSTGVPSLLPASTDTAMTFPGSATASGVVSTAQTPLLQPASAVSMEAWIRFPATPPVYSVVASYGNDYTYAPYQLLFHAGGIVVAQFYLSSGVLEVPSTKALAANTAYHIVSTFDGATGRLYVNGVQVGSGAKTGTIADYGGPYGFAIGDDFRLSDPPFKGTIDEVAVYAGQALTAAQVLNHYNAGTSGIGTTPTPSPVPTATPTPAPTGTPGSGYGAIVRADAPAAFYELDDTSTIAADASGHGYKGTVGASVTEGVPSLVPQSSGTAMAFPGLASAAGVVSVPQNAALQPAAAVSLEAWIRFAALPATYAVVVGYGNDYTYAPYQLFFRAGGTIVMQFALTSGVLEVPSPSHLAVNTTYHVVGTYDGAAGRLFINGAQVASVVKSGTLTDYGGPYGLAIGDDFRLSDPPFKGTVDEVAVYAGKSLSATQVANHYAAGTSGGVPTPTPAPSSAPGVDWLTLGYDLERTGYNPNEHALGTANVAGLKAYWATPYQLSGGEIGSPVYASNVNIGGVSTNVLYAASGSAVLAAVNADTGAEIWKKQLGTANYMCGTGTYTFGANATPAIDRATNRIYVADGAAQVHALDLATGAEANGWPVTVATPADHNFIYGGLTYNPANQLLYAETSSTCDISPWYGRISAISTTTPSILGTFYPTQGTSGGGIWGFGGASIDPSTNDVFVATGNADNANQALDYAEQIVELTPTVGTVLAHSYATLPPSSDSDYGATPLLFQPPGCQALLAAVNKSGLFVLYDRANISNGPLQTIQMSIATDNGDFVGVPAYDPVTHYVYVGLPATMGIYKPGLGAFAMQSNCTLNPTPVWNAQFGADGAALPNDDTLRSPIAIANGVVYISDSVTKATFAFDAASGAQVWTASLNGGGIVGPIVVGGKLYVADESGRITAYTP